ncbi:MAG: hypothetical protein K0B02_02240 [DPANN group archaeon]|nr:hypothetical protein [DPANN group archaeon]
MVMKRRYAIVLMLVFLVFLSGCVQDSAVTDQSSGVTYQSIVDDTKTIVDDAAVPGSVASDMDILTDEILGIDVIDSEISSELDDIIIDIDESTFE